MINQTDTRNNKNLLTGRNNLIVKINAVSDIFIMFIQCVVNKIEEKTNQKKIQLNTLLGFNEMTKKVDSNVSVQSAWPLLTSTKKMA